MATVGCPISRGAAKVSTDSAMKLGLDRKNLAKAEVEATLAERDAELARLAEEMETLRAGAGGAVEVGVLLGVHGSDDVADRLVAAVDVVLLDERLHLGDGGLLKVDQRLHALA